MLAARHRLGHHPVMDAFPFALAGVPVVARASGALWWPGAGLLCVSDLHLGRSERLARRGGTLLPPYETRDTLDRLAAELTDLAPARVVCLGDSFDDDAAARGLAPAETDRLAALAAGRHWIWIAGNHDPAPHGLAGEGWAEFAQGGLVFRHAPVPDAAPGAASGEVAGHFHPKLRRSLGGLAVTRPCFVTDGRRLVMPAFGAYTGGLAAEHPDLAGLFGAGARAILTGQPCLPLPLHPARPRRPAQFA
mgnify:CR=1 FL=1